MNGQMSTDELTRFLIRIAEDCTALLIKVSIFSFEPTHHLCPVPHAASHFLANLLYVSFLKIEFPLSTLLLSPSTSASASLSLLVCFRIQRSDGALTGSVHRAPSVLGALQSRYKADRSLSRSPLRIQEPNSSRRTGSPAIIPALLHPLTHTHTHTLNAHSLSPPLSLVTVHKSFRLWPRLLTAHPIILHCSPSSFNTQLLFISHLLFSFHTPAQAITAA